MTIAKDDSDSTIVLQCPKGFVFVKAHKKGSSYIHEYCRKAKVTKKQLEKETVSAIPFGWDAEVGYDYLKYGRQEEKGRRNKG